MVPLVQEGYWATKVSPNVITCNAAISACETGMQWQSALVLLSRMASVSTAATSITYGAAISACEKGSQWEKALQFLGDHMHEP